MAEPLKLITQEQSWRAEVEVDVVDALKDALARAEAGEFTGVTIAATCKDDCTWHRISKRSNRGLMIGAVARVLHRLHQLDE